MNLKVTAIRTSVLVSAVAAAVLASTGAAQAEEPVGNWDAPPTCTTEGSWNFNDYDPSTGYGNQLGFYEYQGQITDRVFYGGGYELRYYNAYTVSYPGMTAPFQYSMIDAGVAYKHCGTVWHSYTA